MAHWSRTRHTIALNLLAVLAAATPAGAQIGAPAPGAKASKNEPVTFRADSVQYDKTHALVIATGHVEAWQNDHVLRADKITFDRNTGVAAASGHVVLLEPDGEVMFADYAELRNNMRDGILKDMRALLKENGRLAANGAQRTNGKLNELSKVVYSTCNLCAKDPNRPPLWQIKARSAVQDVEHKKIEYYDATLEMYGIPVAYMPYFWHVDPSVKRASGLLPPLMGTASNIGVFYAQPYYWVLDGQSDMTFMPMMTTRAGPQLSTEYRRRFNDGTLTLNTSAGYVDDSPQGSIAANGQFDFDDTWRWGFTINRASSSNYVRDFHLTTGLSGDPNILGSQFYVEGFGDGAYARLDSRYYQALSDAVNSTALPIVLPRFTYSYVGTPDDLGGRLSFSTNDFNVMRSVGTTTRRLAAAADYAVPFVGLLGDQWKVTLHTDAIAYDATRLNEIPSYAGSAAVHTARVLPQLGVDFRWPFARDSGAWGTQLIEPIAQVILAPQTGDSQLRLYPNEDSLDFQFTDANLFGFNRFPGVDRLEGGVRAAVALHGAWYLGGTTFDGLIGQAYRTTPDNIFPVQSGLHDTVSDIVARASFAPTQWLDLTYRTRLDKHSLATRFAEALGTLRFNHFNISGGYLYSAFNPYTYYDQAPPPPTGSAFYFPRNEVSLSAGANFGHYQFSGFVRRDLATNRMVAFGGDSIYENECIIWDLRVFRRNLSINGDSGSTTVLFLVTFKTIGQFGYRAL